MSLNLDCVRIYIGIKVPLFTFANFAKRMEGINEFPELDDDLDEESKVPGETSDDERKLFEAIKLYYDEEGCGREISNKDDKTNTVLSFELPSKLSYGTNDVIVGLSLITVGISLESKEIDNVESYDFETVIAGRNAIKTFINSNWPEVKDNVKIGIHKVNIYDKDCVSPFKLE